ncbi:MAG: hypothetical protein ACP5QG_03015 [candidate division WOR-3 bacterium]
MKPGEDKPYALIEAKSLGENPHNVKVVDQTIEYCSTMGVRFGFITNGESWIVMDEHRTGKSEERVVFEVKLEEDLGSNRKGYEALLLLNPDNEGYLKELCKEIKKHFKTDKRDKHIETALIVKALEKILAAGEWPEDLKVLTHKNPPEFAWLGSREKREKIEGIRSWADLLVSVGEWLVKQGKLKGPVKRETLFLVNDKPEQPNTKMPNPESYLKEIGNGLYIWTHGSAPDSLEKCFYLLEHCGYKPGRNYLKPPEDWKP